MGGARVSTPKKDRPTHRIKPAPESGSFLFRTWCGVGPYRRGVETESPRANNPTTCKACLKAEKESNR